MPLNDPPLLEGRALDCGDAGKQLMPPEAFASVRSTALVIPGRAVGASPESIITGGG